MGDTIEFIQPCICHNHQNTIDLAGNFHLLCNHIHLLICNLHQFQGCSICRQNILIVQCPTLFLHFTPYELPKYKAYTEHSYHKCIYSLIGHPLMISPCPWETWGNIKPWAIDCLGYLIDHHNWYQVLQIIVAPNWSFLSLIKLWYLQNMFWVKPCCNIYVSCIARIISKYI